jgi:hydroxypyruvate reductase
MNSKSKSIDMMRDDAVKIFFSGLKAVEPGAAVKNYCRIDGDHFFVGDRNYDLSNFNNLFVIGAGKASAPMAAAIEDLVGNRIKGGIVNVKYGHTAELEHVKLIEAGHPVPDENGEAGSRAILSLANEAGKDDLVLCLMSGGGSALLPLAAEGLTLKDKQDTIKVLSGGGSALLPLAAEGLTLKDKQDTIKVLLSCGATIHEINAIRKHTSSIKGGRLAQAAYPATLVSLILSDVVGDDLDVIASGPTVPDSSTFAYCGEIFEKYNIFNKLPDTVVKHIEAGISSKISETPKIGDPAFENVDNLIVGSNFEAISAAKKEAQSVGYNTLVLSSMIEGETKHVAHVHGAIAREIVKTGNPLPAPACILSGGETTVTITGSGLGGRCQEFALAAALDISENENIVILSGGTDGNDGPTDAAGAVADSDTINRATAKGLDPRE